MNPQRSWLIWDLKQQWREIASAASKSDMHVMSIASRIASRLQYSQMRLEDLASSYSVQLGAHLHEADPSEYQAFQDGYCFEVYKGIHALFWKWRLLRDTLAEFAARFCFSVANVRTMNHLRKALATNFSTDPLAREILDLPDDLRKAGSQSSAAIEIALPILHRWNKLLGLPLQCKTCERFLTAYQYRRCIMHFLLTFGGLSVNGQGAALSPHLRN